MYNEMSDAQEDAFILRAEKKKLQRDVDCLVEDLAMREVMA